MPNERNAAVAPFVHRAPTTARKQEWLAAYGTGIGHEVRDLEITADADLAFCHFVVRISGTMLDGTDVGMWVRATSCLRKLDDGWKIVHEHASVPFDAKTGKSSPDRRPVTQVGLPASVG